MIVECYKDAWVTFSIDEAQKLFIAVWNDDGKLNATQYKTQMLVAKEIVMRHKPLKSLSDARNFQLAISPELQIWIAHNIFQRKGEEIIEQYAFVVPDGIFAQISLEQMMEESQRDQMTRYFNDMDEARKWLNI